MAEFKCPFCTTRIEREDAAALAITLESFWRWHDDARDAKDPVQLIYAHAECARICLKSSVETIDPGLFVGEE